MEQQSVFEKALKELMPLALLELHAIALLDSKLIQGRDHVYNPETGKSYYDDDLSELRNRKNKLDALISAMDAFS